MGVLTSALDSEPGNVLTTADLLARLARRGLVVSRNQLGQDVQAGYLPRPRPEGRGPGAGVARLWTEAAASRAERLYRLRRRGSKGDVLRLLLFLRDGWGWSRIKRVCLEGVRASNQAQRAPVRRHFRKTPTPKAVEFEIENIAGEAGIKNEPLARFAYGMNLFGAPLPGGTLDPLWSLFKQHGFGHLVSDAAIPIASNALNDLGWTAETILAQISEAPDYVADKGRKRFMLFCRGLRKGIHNAGKAEGWKKSTNLLTLCGQSQRQLAMDFRKGAFRVTPAKMLGGMLGMGIATQAAFSPLEDLFELLDAILQPSASGLETISATAAPLSETNK